MSEPATQTIEVPAHWAKTIERIVNELNLAAAAHEVETRLMAEAKDERARRGFKWASELGTTEPGKPTTWEEAAARMASEISKPTTTNGESTHA